MKTEIFMITRRSKRNRTLTLSPGREQELRKQLTSISAPVSADELTNRIFCDDLLKILEFLPDSFIDLLILDPPYNLDKDFHGLHFRRRDPEGYLTYLESWFPKLMRCLKPDASVYLCGDWSCAVEHFRMMEKHLIIRNRITWQREKGRGALRNWKNASEDILFGTCSDQYYFDPDAVKMRRRVIAPYRADGQPKDWEEKDGEKFRMTFPSNFWDDISVPYWSMPENTDHPTQKPEKLIAKLILASSPENGFVFDPFLGSGTTAVTAKKLGRRFCGIECNPEYCCWALERLVRAEKDARIQGYEDGVFWERNSVKTGKKRANVPSTAK